MAKTEYRTITFEIGEFAEHFPELENRTDLNSSDKLRVALGLKPRKAKAGAPSGNKNAIGNPGRWEKEKAV
jgi:hypothetical protein